MRDTRQQGSMFQEFRNGKNLGRYDNVHSTYGLMNNEHFFWGDSLQFFLFLFFEFFFWRSSLLIYVDHPNMLAGDRYPIVLYVWHLDGSGW
jgi:hypothetical protein